MKRAKIELEFILRASPTIVYQFITQPACLIRWFCDEVDVEQDRYVFNWAGSEEEAELLEDIEDERLRFRWLEADEPSEYFEYSMRKSPLTGETVLEIIDFCDEDEIEDQKELWESQLVRLRQETGG